MSPQLLILAVLLASLLLVVGALANSRRGKPGRRWMVAGAVVLAAAIALAGASLAL